MLASPGSSSSDARCVLGRQCPQWGQPVRTGYEQATLVVRTRQRDLGRRWGLPIVEAFPSVVTMGAPTRSDDHPQMRPS